MEHDEESTNTSGNRPFNEVLSARASRRKFMTGGLAAAAGSFILPSAASAKNKHDDDDKFQSRWDRDDDHDEDRWDRRDSSIEFEPVTVAQGNGPEPSISEDYEYQVLIPWGTPLRSGIAEYTGDPNTRPTAYEQENMIGIGHDGMHFFPLRHRGRNREGILAINHEFGGNSHILGKDSPESDDDIRLSQAAHGVSMVHIRKRRGRWTVVKDSYFNRRITPNTRVRFSGPVSGYEVIQPESEARGTVNNCASGPTPWDTYLTCEENFNGYFGDSIGAWVPTEEQARYGFSAGGFGYGWEGHSSDRRFDLAEAEISREDNRFGWVVEIDPMRPWLAPVKRTALGRFKHEQATVVVGRGKRVVVYMGDDQRFDYIYKFVSDGNWRAMRARGLSPLDHGKLYVARFNDDGTGDWLELTNEHPALAERFGYGDEGQANVLTYARIAADLLGATPMDRPEWISVAPNQDVFCTLTNNSRRDEPNAANPLAPNNDGHIIRWRDTRNHTGLTFNWDIFVFAQDTHGDGDERTFSDPDGIWIDPNGRLFIQTDGTQQKGLNNQMLVASAYDRGDSQDLDIKRLFTGVTDDEITGITVTPNQRTMFINTQHPGNGEPTATNFPAPTDGVTVPRDCTIVISRKDGGIVGS
ncbi:MAG: PhoX family phosphatase [Gammaproteobacteria bacterium]|nr:PhoX family phosphatase [Gammaproteobacteria bacterium]